MSSLCQNPEIFTCILYLDTICSDPASYFLEISILIILVGTLTQIRMGLGCITFPGIRPRRGQYAFLMSKSRMLIHFQPLIIVLGFQPLIFLKWLCLLDRQVPRRKQECGSVASHSLIWGLWRVNVIILSKLIMLCFFSFQLLFFVIQPSPFLKWLSWLIS